MNRTILFTLLGVSLFTLVAFTYKSCETPRSECLIAKGTVTGIAEGAAEDIVFELEGKTHTFYINRGVEYGFDAHALENQLLAEEVTIYYSDEWTLFAPFGTQSKHIREIRNGNWVVYSEF